MNGDGEPKFGYGKDRRGREPYLACERGGTEEDPGHVNGVLKAIAVALTLTLPVAGCTGSEPRPEPTATAWQSIEIDHHSGPAPQPLSGAGPAPGVLREQWRIEDVRAAGALAGSQLAFHLVGGSLLVATGDGVVSYDAGSGAQVWQYREPGRRVFAGVTAGTVVIASQEPDKAIGSGAEGDERLAGLNAATGELLWQRHNQWRVGTYVSLLTVADGFVPAAEAGQHDTPELSGIDARTGEVGWVTSYDDCGSAILDPPRSSDGSLLLLQRHCKGENVVEAYHPATGEQLWTRSWPATGPLPEVSAREGTAMVQTGSRLEVIQADGETSTLEVDPASNDPIHFYLPVEKEHSSSLVDVRTGETVSEGWPKYLSVHAPTLDDDDTLYALEGPHPVPTLMMGQADGGDLTWMPIPGSERVLGSAEWAAAAGQRLLIARQDPADPALARISAYVADTADGPVEFGGVPYEDWPDPCSLRIQDARSTEPRAGEPMVVGGVEYPTQVCGIVLPEPGGELENIEVEIQWVAAAPELAQDWLGGESGPQGVDEIVDGGHYLTARIGRVIVRLTGYVYTEIDPLTVLESMAESLSSY